MRAVEWLRGSGSFRIIFMDPPYGKGLEQPVLMHLPATDLVDEETVIILETDLDTDLSYLPDCGLEIVREKCYKTNRHVFIKYHKEGPAQREDPLWL